MLSVFKNCLHNSEGLNPRASPVQQIQFAEQRLAHGHSATIDSKHDQEWRNVAKYVTNMRAALESGSTVEHTRSLMVFPGALKILCTSADCGWSRISLVSRWTSNFDPCYVSSKPLGYGDA